MRYTDEERRRIIQRARAVLARADRTLETSTSSDHQVRSIIERRRQYGPLVYKTLDATLDARLECTTTLTDLKLSVRPARRCSGWMMPHVGAALEEQLRGSG